MRVAIIPARGGSQRIPHKNIKVFCGKPMLAWSIESALASGCFDQVIVSTDHCKIAEVARQYGATTPFIRPTDLSDDYTGTTPVIRHAIEWLNHQGVEPKQVCCLYATAPFITPEDITRGLGILLENACDYAFTVTSYAFPIQRAIRVTAENRVSMLQPELFNTRSQDLEETYHDAGQFYWGQTNAWLTEKTLLGQGSVPVLMPRHRVQDIDTLEDWESAEWLFKTIKAQAEAKRS